MTLKPVSIENYKVKRRKMESYEWENNYAVKRMYDRLMLVAVSVFEWKNLPDSIDEIYLEKTLLRHGTILFFEDKYMAENGEGEGTYLTLKYMPSYKRDVYGNPIVRRAYSDDHEHYRQNLTHKDSVIINDNVMQTVFTDIIYDFAVHLVDIKEVIKKNLEHQRLPYIIGATDEMKSELQEFFRQKTHNKPYMIVKERMVKDLREALALYPTNAEFIGDKLQDYYDSVWNEFMVMVGIGTNASPKRERLVASEVDSVNEQSQVFAMSRLKSRQRAVKLINKKFDLNIEVDYQFGGNEDGTVHNNSTVDTQESGKDKT